METGPGTGQLNGWWLNIAKHASDNRFPKIKHFPPNLPLQLYLYHSGVRTFLTTVASQSLATEVTVQI